VKHGPPKPNHGHIYLDAAIYDIDCDPADSGQFELTALNPVRMRSIACSVLTRRGGITFTDASGVVTFIPMLQITKITAS